ncbi:MAG TPA: GNAT family N-acetyltransferase [Micromonosporaceae bacterium]|jgi:GNAT superfamily N-acetyltransferase
MTNVVVRPAAVEDVPAIVAMLADDMLGAARESPEELEPYLAAFDRVHRDPNQHLVVLECDGEVVGTLQLTIVAGLSRRGSTRAIVEAVRVAGSARGQRLGEYLIRWSIDEGRRQGCSVVQLTSDATRLDAHRFYERLGFVASHVGFKLAL